MGKSLLIVKNIAHEGAGLLAAELERRAIAVETVDLSTGCRFPDPLVHDALVILGGPQSANDTSERMLQEIEQADRALRAELPVLGICLGLQVLVKAGGGSVVDSPVRETGFFDHEGQPYHVELTGEGQRDPLFAEMSRTFRVFQLHGETVKLTDGMRLLAEGKHCTNQAVRIGNNAYGLQCHFELTPAMLAEWCRLDHDLVRMDTTELAGQFRAVSEEYTATGLLLMRNFLRIAGML